MFKRLRWTVFGALVGAAGSMWARRRVRRTVERYLPEEVSTRARQRLSSAGDDLRAAIEEGRAAMKEHEAELRSRYTDRMIAQPAWRGRIIDAVPPPATLPPGDQATAPAGGLPPTTLRALQRPDTTQSEQDTAPRRRAPRRR
ncbi:MAG: hypothetical protein J2P58_08455 [Acidimicrobiaceae bacterium]|nr:hypothetical protein [Acidimicrobiaceae bacterium]MBO0748084.1 hypothetical protein [Acidimicrobiaceae bacterium]